MQILQFDSETKYETDRTEADEHRDTQMNTFPILLNLSQAYHYTLVYEIEHLVLVCQLYAGPLNNL